MKRRGFLGFMGGAAVAGPQVAKNVVQAMPKGVYDIGGYGGGGKLASAAGHAIATDRDWRLDEVDRLRRLLTGQKTEEEKEADREHRLRNSEPVISQNIMCLLSVAPAAKVRMHKNRMDEINHQAELLYTKRRLSEYLKELGL